MIDYKALGENTIVLDCDVLQADGGTRTAAITGAYVALADAVAHLRAQGALTGEPLTGSVAAVCVGIIDGVPRLDLPYEEDVRAETDMNVVMTGDGAFVEVQGTAEGAPFDRAELDALLGAGREGLRRPHPAAAGGARRMSRRSSSPRATPRSSPRCERILGRAACPTSRCSGSTTSRRTTSRSRTSPTSPATRCSRRAPGCAATGLPSLADDSGLCVDALNGMPGVLSARWAGARARTTPANNELLLDQLADVPDERRGAHFTLRGGLLPPGRDRAASSRRRAR